MALKVFYSHERLATRELLAVLYPDEGWRRDADVVITAPTKAAAVEAAAATGVLGRMDLRMCRGTYPTPVRMLMAAGLVSLDTPIMVTYAAAQHGNQIIRIASNGTLTTLGRWDYSPAEGLRVIRG